MQRAGWIGLIAVAGGVTAAALWRASRRPAELAPLSAPLPPVTLPPVATPPSEPISGNGRVQ